MGCSLRWRYDDGANAIVLDSSGDVYVTDYSSGTGSATIKYNSAGEEQWVARSVGFSDNKSAIAIDG